MLRGFGYTLRALMLLLLLQARALAQVTPANDTAAAIQNHRCSHVFKGPDGRAYDINGRIFCESNGCCYTSRDCRVYIEFPYTPKCEYVDVPSETA